MKKWISMLCALMMLAGCLLPVFAEETPLQEDTVIALVNGEELRASAFEPFRIAYLTQYASAGVDIEDESMKAYVEDLALTAMIEDQLMRQDVRNQGFYVFSEETETWAQEQGIAAYQAALADVKGVLAESLPDASEDDLTVYAEAYAKMLGVTVDEYVEVYRYQMALVKYYQWLTSDNPVTDEEVAIAHSNSDQADSELTDELYTQYAYEIYQERVNAALKLRMETLSQEAVVTFPE